MIDLAPIGWVPTKKRRPRQPLTGCLAGWLPVWNKEDEARRAAALAADRTPPELGLIVYKGKRVATVKRAFRRIGAELGLMGFSQYSLRHFMADQIKKLFRNVPREQRSLWMGHVVRDGSRTTANYEFRRSGNARGCRAGNRLRNRTNPAALRQAAICC